MTAPDPRGPARLAAEWEVRRLHLDNGCEVGLTVDTLVHVFLPLIEALADSPEMLELCMWRRAEKTLEMAGDQHC